MREAPCSVDGCAAEHVAEFGVTDPLRRVVRISRDVLANVVEIGGCQMLLLCGEHESVLRETVGDTLWRSP